MATTLVQNLITGLSSTVAGYDGANTQTRLALLGQASMLLRTVAEPEEMVGIHIANMMESIAIRTLMSLKVFQSLPDEGSISLTELSSKLGAEEALLARLLRMAVACQLVQQLPDLTFAHTKFSRGYAADPGPGLGFQLLYDEVFLMLTRFPEYLKEKGLVEPPSQYTSPYAWTEGQEGKTIWDIMSSHPERFATFQRGLPFYDASLPKTGYYDFGKLAEGIADDRVALVDIGCGMGQTALEILKTNPKLPASKLILQDTAVVVAAAKAEGHLPADLKIEEHDFYTSQPVKGAKAYYFRRILHDYSDKICVQILQQIVPAMASDSLLLVSDYVVPERITPADIEVATAGVVMFQMAGKERTEEDFRRLFNSVGLELTGVFTPGFGSYGLVEARLAEAVPIANGSTST